MFDPGCRLYVVCLMVIPPFQTCSIGFAWPGRLSHLQTLDYHSHQICCQLLDLSHGWDRMCMRVCYMRVWCGSNGSPNMHMRASSALLCCCCWYGVSLLVGWSGLHACHASDGDLTSLSCLYVHVPVHERAPSVVS